MAPYEINDERSLTAWLSDKPKEWAQEVALGAALRALPYIGFSSGSWLGKFALLPLSATLTSWTQLYDHSIFVRNDESRANGRFGGVSFNFADYKSYPIAALAADASYHSADAQSRSMHVISDCVKAVEKSHAAFNMVIEKREELGEELDVELVGARIWFGVQSDCNWLSADDDDGLPRSEFLRPRGLWSSIENDWITDWHRLERRLRSIDPNYSVWIDWYERRIRGERAAFDIPGDKRRVEDKKILRRLAEATDEDFWGKGHEYVNATLKGWLGEARARVAPPQPDGETEIRVPLQEPHAIAYGVNNDGMIDRLPHSDQTQLRDVPDQRRAYDDLREAAAELLGEGQRLGHRLQRALDRFLHSLPDGFEYAEAYLVWRDANALRRLHRAHREAAKSGDPDEARLEPVVAEGLGGLLDLYNNFAFADDGLRAKDEARVAPQERANAQAEAKAAIPLVKAILANPEIATPEALEDILADAENAELPGDDPYAAQVLLQSNESRKNFLAAALAWGAKTLASPKQVGKAVAIGSVTGAAGVVGKVAMTAITGTDYGPLLPFIAANAEILQRYVAIAFPSFDHLPSLIDQLKLLWAKRRH